MFGLLDPKTGNYISAAYRLYNMSHLIIKKQLRCWYSLARVFTLHFLGLPSDNLALFVDLLLFWASRSVLFFAR